MVVAVGGRADPLEDRGPARGHDQPSTWTATLAGHVKEAEQVQLRPMEVLDQPEGRTVGRGRIEHRRPGIEQGVAVGPLAEPIGLRIHEPDDLVGDDPGAARGDPGLVEDTEQELPIQQIVAQGVREQLDDRVERRRRLRAKARPEDVEAGLASEEFGHEP